MLLNLMKGEESIPFLRPEKRNSTYSQTRKKKDGKALPKKRRAILLVRQSHAP
jgi:hypothetical protein